MDKKTVIVSGASGNLGKAVVKKFLSEQCRVIGAYASKGSEVIDFNNPGFEKSIVDLMDEESTRLFAEKIINKYRYIDVAVLTVGGFVMGNIAETKSADILKQYKLNFETAFNLARPVFLQMQKQKKGYIFLIGSRPGLDPGNAGGMVAYSLSKSLIFRLAELLNDEGKNYNVVTNVIIPSIIDTPQNRKSMPGADFNTWVTSEAIADIIYLHTTKPASILRESLIKVYGNT